MPAKPATIEHELHARVNRILFGMTEYLSGEDFEIRSLLKDADKLANASGIASSIIKAEIYQLTGNAERVRYWIDNARKLGHAQAADRATAIYLSNLGFFSEAAPAYERATSEVGQLKKLAAMGTLFASFGGMEKAAALAAQAKLEVDMEPHLTIAKNARAVLSRLGVSEAQLRTMLDAAGEVMRRHRLMWADEFPVIRTFSDDEDAALLYQLRLPVSSEEAFEMTSEAIDLMIDRDILLPGVAFSFLSNEK